MIKILHHIKTAFIFTLVILPVIYIKIVCWYFGLTASFTIEKEGV